MIARESKTTFFRQSGWMMMASTLSGAFMFAVHFLNQKIPKSEYAVLGVLLTFVIWLQIPTIGVQSVFAQQAAAALTDSDRRKLAGRGRDVVRYSFWIWLGAAALGFIFPGEILSTLGIANPAGLWVTLALALISLWSPVFTGVLQGQQNFFWMGWASILNGAGRVCVAVFFVLVLKSFAAGIMLGALCGALPALLISAWKTHSAWWGPMESMPWKPWLARVVPLTLGLATTQIMLTFDTILVRSVFPFQESPYYVPIATVGRALVLFTAPLATILFPKVVRNLALAQTSDVLKLTLISTAVLGVCAAVGLMIVAVPLFKIVFPQYVQIAPLTGVYAWSILPQALATVLINNLLAHERYRSIPFLLVVTMSYVTALTLVHDSFSAVLRVMGGFSLIFFAVSAFFAWRKQ